MKNIRPILLTAIFLIGTFINQSFAQASLECYTVPNSGSRTIFFESGKLYRVTIKSCWMSAYARMGTYLIYVLNISDPMTNGEPSVLTIAETSSIDWTFSYSLSGSYSLNMTITSGGWGDQGLLILVEGLQCNGSNVKSNSDLLNDSYKLSQNYPNPLNPSTTIEYSVQVTNNIQIKIYDSSGQLVKTVVNETKTPGEYSVVWDGKDDSGTLVASGAYFYQIQTKYFVSSKKMIFLK